MEAIVYSYSLTNVTKFPTKMDKKMVRYKTLKYFGVNILYSVTRMEVDYSLSNLI